jgi:hypothetical protein
MVRPRHFPQLVETTQTVTTPSPSGTIRNRPADAIESKAAVDSDDEEGSTMGRWGRCLLGVVVLLQAGVVPASASVPRVLVAEDFSAVW